jgi:hypothetical protein
MFLGLIKHLLTQKSKGVKEATENTIFVMNLMWKVANSEEFGSHSLRQFTTKLRLYSD